MDYQYHIAATKGGKDERLDFNLDARGHVAEWQVTWDGGKKSYGGEGIAPPHTPQQLMRYLGLRRKPHRACRRRVNGGWTS